jgi:V-type H+-transporting ATPase subunit C
MQQLWLVTVPNNKESPDRTYDSLRQEVEAGGTNCRIHRFEMPSLVVGTLDSLMALSDELSKINSQVEVRNIFGTLHLDSVRRK